MTIPRTPGLIHQPFESGIFGQDVFRLDPKLGADDLTIAGRAAAELVRSGSAALVSCRLPQGDPAISELVCLGFREVERLVRYEKEIVDPQPAPERVRPAVPADKEACVDIARSGFASDRFHADPCISDALADEVKAAWVENCFKGRSDLLLVGQGPGGVSGFVTCLATSNGEAIVDLIAVGKEHRGMGWGADLLRGCLAGLHGSAHLLAAGTQATNSSSIRMYIGLGFERGPVQVTLHICKEQIQ